MSTQPSDRNLALFIDFDNVALGARDARMRFDCRLLLQRVLEKGKVVVKKAYADWHHYKEHMTSLHEAAIELIEVPMPRISGKNSADIRMVVDAIDLCWSKDHIDTFVLVSGDSDFSPLVSKLRENNKRVIGVGMRNSSSHLLISNCDEWIFYDDIYQTTVVKLSEKVASVPADKRELFDFLLNTTQSLLQESRGVLFSSLVKDTMKRKQPDFNETNYGYATFGDLLEDMRDHGLITVERDSRAGGTLVVLGLGKTDPLLATRTKARRSRRGRDRDRPAGEREAEAGAPPQPERPEVPLPRASEVTEAATARAAADEVADKQSSEDAAAPGDERSPARRSRRRSSRRRRGGRAEGTGPGTEANDFESAGPESAGPSSAGIEANGNVAPARAAEPRVEPVPPPAPEPARKKTTARKTTRKTADSKAPDAKAPDAKAPDARKPSAPRPAPTKSPAAKPAGAKPAVARSSAARPSPAKPVPPKPGPARTAKKTAKKAGRGGGGGGRGEE